MQEGAHEGQEERGALTREDEEQEEQEKKVVVLSDDESEFDVNDSKTKVSSVLARVQRRTAGFAAGNVDCSRLAPPTCGANP